MTFILVHGSFSNSFSWTPLARELTLRGHRALAVDHVVEVVRRVAEHGPVVLVGHSRGGLTLTGVGNRVPDLVDRLVYISAWCCVDLTVGDYMQEPEYETSAVASGVLVGAPTKLGALRTNWRTADPALLAELKNAMFAEGTDHEFRAFLNTLEPDESIDAGTERADAATWGRIPRTYVRLTADRALPLALQDRFIAEADALTPDNPTDVRSIDSSHLRFHLHAGDLVDVIDGLAIISAAR